MNSEYASRLDSDSDSDNSEADDIFDSGSDTESYSRIEDDDSEPYWRRPKRPADNCPQESKERILRRGVIPLSLISDYGQKSGWGVREGVRELLQNLYFTLQCQRWDG